MPAGFRWFVDALGIPMADQLRGPVGGEPFEVSGVSGAVGICYENMFGEELRHAWDQANPIFILNTANLGWFSEAVLPQFTGMSAHESPRDRAPIDSGRSERSLCVDRPRRKNRTVGFGRRPEYGSDACNGDGEAHALCTLRSLAVDWPSGTFDGWGLGACTA